MVPRRRGWWWRRLSRGLICEDVASKCPEPLLTIVGRERKEVVVLVLLISAAVVRMLPARLPLSTVVQEEGGIQIGLKIMRVGPSKSLVVPVLRA